MSIRILIADDHRILRAGLKTLLRADPNLEVIGEATDGKETVEAVTRLKPNILLMDISMPETNGLETIRQVLQSSPDTRILVLTMHEDGMLLQEYLHAGASGYIIKRAAETELIDAIYAVWRGIIYIHPSLVSSLTEPKKVAPAQENEADPLTPREVEILRLIAQGYSNRQVAERLNLSVRTVETHRFKIMEKLDLHSRLNLVRYASQHGIIKFD